MKTFLKIIFSLILLAAITLAGVYLAYKDVFLAKVRNILETEITTYIGRPVQIGSLKYSPPWSISIKNITFPVPDGSNIPAAGISNIIFTLDIPCLAKNKQLKTRIVIDKLRIGDISFNAVLRTVSRKADAYKNAFNLPLLTAVSIAETSVSGKRFDLSDIQGELTISNMSLSSCKMFFTSGGVKYSADLTAMPRGYPEYNVSLNSDHSNLQSTFTLDNGTLDINSLTGSFYALRFDLKGKFQNCFSREISGELKGTVESDLAKFSLFPGKTGNFARNYPMSGLLTFNICLETKGPVPGNYKLTSTVSADDLLIKNFQMKEITGDLLLENGRISTRFINGTIYDGAFTCAFEMDLLEKDFPYNLSLIIENMDFGSLMKDITGKKASGYGIFTSELFLNGRIQDPGTIAGNWQINISDADLGPMPVLTPLFGNIFSTVQKILPDTKRVNINEAFADFTIKDSKIMTNNLTFLGEDICITSEGYMDFSGNLNFVFKNRINESFKEQETQDESWQIFLKNAITRFGKIMDKAYLRGTIKKPEWKFEYFEPIKTAIRKNVRNFLDTFEQPF